MREISNVQDGMNEIQPQDVQDSASEIQSVSAQDSASECMFYANEVHCLCKYGRVHFLCKRYEHFLCKKQEHILCNIESKFYAESKANSMQNRKQAYSMHKS